MARPSRRQLLLDVALDRFAEQGYDGTSVGELAADAGVSKAAVSYHFPAKDDLLAELAEPVLAELEALVDAATAEDGHPVWPDGVRALIEGYLDVLLRHRDVAVWLDGDRGGISQSDVGARLVAVNRAVRGLLVAGRRTPRARIAASTALGALWRPVRSIGADDVGEHTDLVIASAMAPLAMVTTYGDPTGPGT